MRLPPSAVAACFTARPRDEQYLPQVFRFHLIPTPPAETGAALLAPFINPSPGEQFVFTSTIIAG